MTGEMSPRAQEILSRYEELDHEHMQMRHVWREVGKLVIPRSDMDLTTPGQRNDVQRWDDTAPLSNWLAASAIHSSAMPQNSTWLELHDEDEGFNIPRAQKIFFQTASDKVHQIMADPERRFYGAGFEATQEFTGLGTGIAFEGDKPGYGPWWQAVPVQQARIGTGERGDVDTLYRAWTQPGRNVLRMFGKDKLGPKTLKLIEDNPKQPLEILHAVEPRPTGRRGMAGRLKPITSDYMVRTAGEIISEGGFETFPYQVARYAPRTGERYGWGIGCNSLAQIKFVNELALRIVQAVQLAIAPPMWVPAEGMLNELSLSPWAHNYYEADRPYLDAPKALEMGQRDFPVGLEMLKNGQDNIRRYFAVDWMDQQTREMTRLQFQLSRDDRLKIQAPMLSSLTSEFCGPAIKRTFDILWQSRRLPQPPAQLIRKGVKLKVTYHSPLTRLQRYGELEAIMATAEFTAMLAKIDQSATFKLDVATAIEAFTDRNGTPAIMVRDAQQVAAMQQRLAEQQAAAAEAQQAQAGAAAARDMAHAISMAQPPGQASAPRPRAVAA